MLNILARGGLPRDLHVGLKGEGDAEQTLFGVAEVSIFRHSQHATSTKKMTMAAKHCQTTTRNPKMDSPTPKRGGGGGYPTKN